MRNARCDGCFGCRYCSAEASQLPRRHGNCISMRAVPWKQMRTHAIVKQLSTRIHAAFNEVWVSVRSFRPEVHQYRHRRYGEFETCAQICRLTANINAVTGAGETPLHALAECGDWEGRCCLARKRDRRARCTCQWVDALAVRLERWRRLLVRYSKRFRVSPCGTSSWRTVRP